MKEFKVEFNLADSEYMTAVRLVTGAVCTVHGLDVDTLEDFKVCVTESVIMLKNCGFASAQMVFCGGKGVECTVTGMGGKPCGGDNELSLALIEALVGECEIKRRGEIIEEVILKV